MDWRDYFVYGLLILIVGSMLLYMLWAMLRPAKGTWNEREKELGRYRARHWTYKREVPNLKAHLLGQGGDTHYWPALANAVGHDALFGTDKHRNMSWASAIVQAIGAPQRVYISVHMPLRSDARTPDLPEILLANSAIQSAAGWSTSAARNVPMSETALPDYLENWQLTTAEPAAAQELIASMPQAITHDPDLMYVHIFGETVTYVRTYRAGKDRVELIERYLDKTMTLSTSIPEKFWT